jgi:hypothetical protein
MPSAGFEHAIPAIKRPHTYALDRTAIGMSSYIYKISEDKRSTILNLECL